MRCRSLYRYYCTDTNPGLLGLWRCRWMIMFISGQCVRACACVYIIKIRHYLLIHYLICTIIWLFNSIWSRKKKNRYLCSNVTCQHTFCHIQITTAPWVLQLHTSATRGHSCQRLQPFLYSTTLKCWTDGAPTSSAGSIRFWKCKLRFYIIMLQNKNDK